MEEMNNAVQVVEERVPAEVRPIETIEAEIWLYKQQAGASILEIGRRLIEAKAQLEHGEWLVWLEEKVDFSETTAQRFMRLAREYANPSPVTDLGASKALALLALPASEREEFVAETHTVNGEEKTVAEMSRRELEAAIRERDEARKAMEGLKDTVAEAESRVKEYQAQLTKALEDAAAEQQEAEAEIENLRRKLEQLREEPAAVAVEPVVDQAAIEKAKAEVEEQLKKKIAAAEKAKEKAERAKADAEQEMAAMKVAQEEANAVAEQEKKAMAEQVQALQKKLAVASSSEMVIFKLHFEQGQQSINKMTECIGRMAEAGDAEGAEKLKNALRALLKATQEVLG